MMYVYVCTRAGAPAHLSKGDACVYARTCVCMCARLHVRACARKRALEVLLT